MSYWPMFRIALLRRHFMAGSDLIKVAAGKRLLITTRPPNESNTYPWKTLKKVYLHYTVMKAISATLFSLFFFAAAPVVAQHRILDSLDINAGLSGTDHNNVGLRYRRGQNSFGLNGSLWWRQNVGLSWAGVSATYYRHLWGKSAFAYQRPWYLKTGIHYSYHASELTPREVSSVRQAGTRFYLGRELNVSWRWGFSVAGGAAVTLWYEWYDGHRGSRPFVEPGVDILAFYRLGRRASVPEDKKRSFKLFRK